MIFDVFSAQSIQKLTKRGGSWTHATVAGGKMRLINSLMYHDDKVRTCKQVRTDLIAEGYPSDIIVSKAD